MTDPNTITVVIPATFDIDGLVAILTSVSVLGSIVVKMFPTLPTGHWLLPVLKFVSRFIALNRTVNDKEARNEK